MGMNFPANSTTVCLFLILSFPHHTLPFGFGHPVTNPFFIPGHCLIVHAISLILESPEIAMQNFFVLIWKQAWNPSCKHFCRKWSCVVRHGLFQLLEISSSARHWLVPMTLRTSSTKLGAQEMKWRSLCCSSCNVFLPSMNDWRKQETTGLDTTSLLYTLHNSKDKFHLHY